MNYIVYSIGDLIGKMVDKERIWLFHWTQLLNRHTKQFITFNIQEQHKVLYSKNIKLPSIWKK
jgi:hypothetical protein